MNTARHLIDLTKQLGIRLVGVAFHVGCSNSNPNFHEEIEKCRILFDYAKSNHDIEMHILDIGGGYPGIDEDNEIFIKTAQDINKGKSFIIGSSWTFLFQNDGNDSFRT